MILEVSKTFKTNAARASNDQMIMKRNANHSPRLFQAIYRVCGRNVPGLGQQVWRVCPNLVTILSYPNRQPKRIKSWLTAIFLNQASRLLAVIGWQGETGRRKRENFSIAIGYANGMFKLSRQAFIARHRRPAIIQNFGF